MTANTRRRARHKSAHPIISTYPQAPCRYCEIWAGARQPVGGFIHQSSTWHIFHEYPCPELAHVVLVPKKHNSKSIQGTIANLTTDLVFLSHLVRILISLRPDCELAIVGEPSHSGHYRLSLLLSKSTKPTDGFAYELLHQWKLLAAEQRGAIPISEVEQFVESVRGELTRRNPLS